MISISASLESNNAPSDEPEVISTVVSINPASTKFYLPEMMPSDSVFSWFLGVLSGEIYVLLLCFI